MISWAKQHRFWIAPTLIIWWLWSSMAACQALTVVNASEDSAQSVDHSHHQMMIEAVDNPQPQPEDNAHCQGEVKTDGSCSSCCDTVAQSVSPADSQQPEWSMIVWNSVFDALQPRDVDHSPSAYTFDLQYNPPDIFLLVCSFLQ